MRTIKTDMRTQKSDLPLPVGRPCSHHSCSRRRRTRTCRQRRGQSQGCCSRSVVKVHSNTRIALAVHAAISCLPLNVEALPVAVLLVAIARERTPLGESAIRREVAAVEDLVQRGGLRERQLDGGRRAAAHDLELHHARGREEVGRLALRAA